MNDAGDEFHPFFSVLGLKGAPFYCFSSSQLIIVFLNFSVLNTFELLVGFMILIVACSLDFFFFGIIGHYKSDLALRAI